MGYDAFMSYNHAADGDLAPAVERGLQRLARPWYRLRAISIFRDMSDSGLNPSLWGTVQQRLDDAAWLIVLACPESAGSQWVHREVEYWIDTKGVERILLVLTGGELCWDAAAGRFSGSSSALAADLSERFTSEPLYLDLRWTDGIDAPTLQLPRFRADIARLASPIRGVPPDELEGEDLRLQRRARRLARGAVCALVVLAVAATIAAVVAVANGNQAERRARQATARQVGLLALDAPADRLDQSLLLAVAASRLDPSNDDRFLAARTLIGRNARLTKLLPVPGDGASSSIGAVAVAGDGRRVAALDLGDSETGPALYVWDLAAGSEPTRRRVERPTSNATAPSVSFADDGTAVVSWTGTAPTTDPTGRFDVETGRRLVVRDTRTGDTVISSPDKAAAIAWSDCQANGTNDANHDAESGGVPHLDGPADRCRLVTVGETLDVWNPATGERIRLQDQTNAQAVAITPDGATVVSAGWGPTVAVWSLDVPIDDTVRTDLDAPVPVGDDAVRFEERCDGDLIAVSPESTMRAAYRRSDGRLVVCRTSDGSLVAGAQNQAVTFPATAIAVDDDGNVALGGNGLVEFDRLEGGAFSDRAVATDTRFGAESTTVTALALRAGRLVAGVEPDGGDASVVGRVVVWDVDAGGAAVQFDTDHPEVAAVALLGDDADALAVAGRDSADGPVVVKVWETESRRRLGRGLGGLQGEVVELSGDETAVVGMDGSGNRIRWSLDVDPRSDVCSIVGRGLSREEWETVAAGALARYAFDPVCG